MDTDVALEIIDSLVESMLARPPAEFYPKFHELSPEEQEHVSLEYEANIEHGKMYMERVVRNPTMAAKAMEAFAARDVNGDGTLSLDEHLDDCLNQFAAAYDDHSFLGGFFFLSRYDRAKEDVVEASAAFFYEMDRDIDGHVTPEEWLVHDAWLKWCMKLKPVDLAVIDAVRPIPDKRRHKRLGHHGGCCGR
jgi:hypothetical protein